MVTECRRTVLPVLASDAVISVEGAVQVCSRFVLMHYFFRHSGVKRVLHQRFRPDFLSASVPGI